jgi:hypothetical protein
MFSLSDLTPEREPFDLGNGQTIHFRNRSDFDLQELAAWERLRKTMEKVVEMRRKAADEQQHAFASTKSETAARELISLILPDLPSEILTRLTSGQIDHLAAMCITVASGQMRGAAANEAQLAEIAQRYPDLPAEFVASLNRSQAARLLGEEAAPEKKARGRQRTS